MCIERVSICKKKHDKQIYINLKYTFTECNILSLTFMIKENIKKNHSLYLHKINYNDGMYDVDRSVEA